MKLAAVLATAALTLVLATPPSGATVFCEVLKTPDGFLALRKGPSRNAKLLRKLKPGAQVQVGLDKNGRWEKVIYWGGTAKPMTGWVHGRYLSNECG